MEKIILGVDPGTTVMGFGIIQVMKNQMKFVQMNELILSKYDDHYLKLKLIFERTTELIDTYKPDELAIEAPFFGKNVQSMLNGNASKEQVAKMLQQLLHFRELPEHLDATDGLAVAVCHFFNGGKTEKNKSYASWEAFVKHNENRIS